MFIAMNRFQVIRGEEDAFEQVWLNRDVHLDGVPGFIEFHLLRGEAQDGVIIKVVQTSCLSSENRCAARRATSRQR